MVKLAARKALSALQSWLMTIGPTRAVIVIVVFSTSLSLLMSATAMSIFMPTAQIGVWAILAIAVPATISPIVGIVVMSLSYQLAEARAALAEVAETDPLTGIGNRRRFMQAAERDLARSARDGSPLSLLILDIDHFKQLNDRYGHAAGDTALTTLAQYCGARLRASDLVCRWGGEEFVVLLPGTSLRDACAFGDTLRQAIAQMSIDGIAETLTVSIGAAEVSSPNTTLDEVIAVADQQLYLAKAAGRNCVLPKIADRGAVAA